MTNAFRTLFPTIGAGLLAAFVSATLIATTASVPVGALAAAALA